MQRLSKPSGIGRLIVLCVAFSAAAVSCGGDDDDDSSSATTPTTASVCADREALQTSVDSLQGVDLVAEGTNGVNAAIDDVQEDLSALQTSAGAELQPEVQAVQDDVDALKTAAENLDSSGAAGASDAAAAVASVASSVSTLLGSLADGPCGSPTPTT